MTSSRSPSGKSNLPAKAWRRTALGLKAKVEFQSQMVAFLMARRFRHSMITSAFYRVLFKGSNQNIVVGAIIIGAMGLDWVKTKG